MEAGMTTFDPDTYSLVKGGEPDGPDEHHDQGGLPEPKPGRSTVKFPYTDLKEAVRVCVTIKDNFGGSGCDLDQLAGQLQQSARSGAFRTRIAAAASFGLVVSRKNRVTLTALGHKAAAHSEAAYATAFLNVELYKKLYDRYRGDALPADAGLTVEIQELGVLPTQSDRARQVMQRSAQFAGFFHAGRDRLILPPTGTVDRDAQGADTPVDRRQGGAAQEAKGGANMANSPLLQGLWGMLPASGEFPAEKRAQWFRALAVNLDLVYGDGHLDVQVIQSTTPELRRDPAR